MDANGQAAIVTGGGSGLGEAVAGRLAEAGCRVAVLDIDAAAAQRVAGRIGGAAFACDVADPDGAAAALDAAAAAHGAARIVVNCAGIGPGQRIVGRDGAMPLPAFERVVRVNLLGSFNILRLAAAAMTTLPPLADGERGIVVLTASIAAFEGQVGQAAYAASKGGVASLTLPAARELAQFGVRVVTIAPGLFETPLFASVPPAARQALAESVPFPRRLGEPAEFAALVEHAIANTMLNGAVLRLDGALRMGSR
ncbi:MAG TPA: SDR family NAD(P)-dependent oxidoreductase [Acetobacteraceae bacterium]|nr:SDR family NAD(P)-dependent oxidoreductase [Acetobacteraceae bacterium]